VPCKATGTVTLECRFPNCDKFSVRKCAEVSS
jgi:hypothetical protein